MKIDAANPRHWLLLLLQGLYTLLAIVLRPLRTPLRPPLVILYGHQLSGNLQALYREWQRSGQHQLTFYFLSLDPAYSARLKRAGVQVLQCNLLRDMLKLSQASAIITDHGLHLMTPLLRFTDILFIDVWHGIPFKGFVPDDFKLQHRYDEIWVSSPMLKHLYETRFGFRPDQVKALGYARTDKLFQATGTDSDFRKAATIPADRKIVLYAPTWQHDDQGRELFPFGESEHSFIGRLSRQCQACDATLVVRGHLNARIEPVAFDNVLYCSQKDFADTEELLLATDVLICDWSSIAFDFLALNRPTLFLDVPPPFRHGFSLGAEYRFGRVITDMDSLLQALIDYLQRPQDYAHGYANQHRLVIEAAYGTSAGGGASSRQLEHLRNLLSPQ